MIDAKFIGGCLSFGALDLLRFEILICVHIFLSLADAGLSAAAKEFNARPDTTGLEKPPVVYGIIVCAMRYVKKKLVLIPFSQKRIAVFLLEPPNILITPTTDILMQSFPRTIATSAMFMDMKTTNVFSKPVIC